MMIDITQIQAALSIGKWINKHFSANKVDPLVSHFIVLFKKNMAFSVTKRHIINQYLRQTPSL